MPQPEALKKIRMEVSNYHEELEAIINAPSFQTTFGDLDREEGMVLTRPPKGYSDDNPAIEYLKFKSFTATQALAKEELADPNSIDKVVSILTDLKPFIDFLNRALREN